MDGYELSKRNLSESFTRNFLTNVSFGIRFPPLLEIQNNIPKFQRKVRDVFPKLRMGFPIASISIGISPPLAVPGETEWAFLSEDEKHQVKTTFNRCVVISTEYQGYEEFLKLAMNTFDPFAKIMKIDKFSRIGLRYVNEIPLTGNSPPSDEVLRLFNPIFDQDRIRLDKPFLFNSEYRSRSKSDVILSSKNALLERPGGGHHYIIDLDLYVNQTAVPPSNLKNVVNQLHSHAREEFHRNIKDDFLNVLRGEN